MVQTAVATVLEHGGMPALVGVPSSDRFANGVISRFDAVWYRMAVSAGGLPCGTRLDPRDLAGAFSHILLADVLEGRRLRPRLVGQRHIEIGGVDLVGRSFAPADTGAPMMLCLARVLTERRPVHVVDTDRGLEWAGYPLSRDGVTVDRLAALVDVVEVGS